MALDGPRVAIVGGSLGGLIAALVLRDAGCDVQVFERSRSPLEGRGAGIVLHPVTVRSFEERGLLDLARVSSSTRVLRYITDEGGVLLEEPINYLFTSYATLYAALVGRLEPERYHLGAECAELTQDAGGVTVRLSGGREERADLVVGADGIHSTVRGLLFPGVLPTYAGYVGWRGTLGAPELPPVSGVSLGGVLAYYVGRGTHVLSYPIPAEGEGRLMNWVWYRNVPAGPELDDLMTDRSGIRRDLSLPAGAVRDPFVRELRDAASGGLPPPFSELVAVTSTPFVQVIADVQVPRMTVGRICLIGDAAFVLRPHIAAATAKAAADAQALASALEAAGGEVVSALAAWEPDQLALGRRAFERARDVGDRVQFAGTFSPGDPQVAFGLREPKDSNFPASYG